MDNYSTNDPNKKPNQKRDRFNFNTPELIENRGKNNDLLSSKGWICVALKVDENDSYLRLLNSKGWFISRQDNIWLPQLPRIDDCISLIIMNTELLKEYGVNAEFEEYITVKVGKITMESISPDMEFNVVQQNLSSILYYIGVSIVEIPSLSALDFE